MNIFSLDVEADGFLDVASKIHCMSVKPFEQVPLTYLEDDIQSALDALPDNSVCLWHNGWGYDLPLLEMFGVNWGKGRLRIVDTLAIAREWWPDCPRGHSLEAWAKVLGSSKLAVTDWKDQPIEVYIERCEGDTITTELVYKYLLERLG
jgi:hypothetical protein